VNSAGHYTALPSWMVQCVVPPLPGQAEGGVVRSSTGETKEGGRDAVAACFDRMNAEGYRQRIVYQPAGHFWPLQYMETGVVLALSGLLAWFCFWRIRQVS
jgi:hypothetical protein